MPMVLFEEYEYDFAGNVTSMTNRRGYEIHYVYDDLYRLTGANYPDSSINTIQYLKWDSDSNIGTGDLNGYDADKVVSTDGTGVQSIKYYDKAGRLAKTSVSDGTTEIVTAQYEYDLIGNCITTTDNAGRVSNAEYNALGQQTRVIVDPEGENIVTVYTYDLLGNKTNVTDGEGYTTSYAYDDDFRLGSVTQVDNNGTVTTADDITLTTSYDYDIDENGYIKTCVTDAANKVSETWFDAIGRKVKEVNVGDTNDSTIIETGYIYDANSNVSLVTRNDNTKEKYTYDSMGLITRIDYYEALENTSIDSDDYTVYEYNDSGNPTLMSVYHGTAEETTAYSYDSMDRVIQITEGDLNNGGLGINYSYDNGDRVTALSYVKESTLRTLGYVYDSFGRIQYITLAVGEGSAQTVREYVYKANGDLDYMKDYRNFTEDGTDYIKVAYEINDAGLMTQITYTDCENGQTPGTVKEQYTMSYDDRGYIIEESAYTNYGTTATVNKSYSYDSIGRLTEAEIGNNTTMYSYDNVGNRISENDGNNENTYEYDQFNRLIEIDQKDLSTNIEIDGYATYVYDARGNQTEEQELKDFDGIVKKQTTAYSYDLMNNMSSAMITASGETTQSEINVYNAAGQRVKRVENSSTTKYYYTGSELLFTTDVNNYLLTENILDLSGGIIASMRFHDQDPLTEDPYADQYFFYHYDMRGSVTTVIQPDGGSVLGYTYDEFGNLERTGASDFLNELTFTGCVSDISTGLQYMNARYYDSQTGRFLSQDTYSGNPYDPWTQHLYSYCGNNPTSMIDPTGHSWDAAAVAGNELFNYSGTFANSDGPLPIGDAIGLVLAAGAAICYVAYGVSALIDWITASSGATSATAEASVTTTDYAKAESSIMTTKEMFLSSRGGELVLPPVALHKVKSKAKEEEKTKEKEIVDTEKPKGTYYPANLIAGNVIVNYEEPLTYPLAIERVYEGGSLMCITKSSAYAVARVFPNYVGPEKSGGGMDGFYNHYHPNRYSDVHIWYLY